MVFSRQLSQQMRGFAILCVCMHNLLHLVCRAKECEFAFYPERVDRLMAASVTPWNLVECFFSFFGWYFILVFVMFSGYGLVCKHEKVEKGKMKVRSYLWHNFLKLFVLLAPGYLLYLLLNDKPVEWYAVVSQLTLTINLIDFEWIAPGVYWYLGLTMQFYLIYLFFHRFRDRRCYIGHSRQSASAGEIQQPCVVARFGDGDMVGALSCEFSPCFFDSPLDGFIVGVDCVVVAKCSVQVCLGAQSPFCHLGHRCGVSRCGLSLSHQASDVE